jgi:hypothetical protein
MCISDYVSLVCGFGQTCYTYIFWNELCQFSYVCNKTCILDNDAFWTSFHGPDIIL